MNNLQLFGRVGRDPEIRATQSGSKIASLSLAISEKRKDQSGQWQEHTTWVRCKVFGGSANFVEQHIRKGDFVAASGKLEIDQWEKDGQKRESAYCFVDRIEKAWAPKADQPQYNNPQSYGRQAPAPAPAPQDDFLPF